MALLTAERLSVYRLSKDSSDFNDSEFQKVMDVIPLIALSLSSLIQVSRAIQFLHVDWSLWKVNHFLRYGIVTVSIGSTPGQRWFG